MMRNIIRNILTSAYDAYMDLYVRIVYILNKDKIQNNKIIFSNFSNRGYGDNPKYIAEELLNTNCNLDLVWVVKDLSETMPDGIRKVRVGSASAIKEYCTARIWIDNVRNSPKPPKKDGQVYLQTWHGSIPAKSIEKDAEGLLDKKYIKKAKRDGKITDAILVDSMIMENVYKRAFWLNDNVEYLKYGFPRDDYILKNKNNIVLISQIRDEIGLQDEYVVLYAPTFRDDYSTRGFVTRFADIISEFENRMKKSCCVIVKLHPNDRKNKDFFNYSDKVIDGTDFPDMQKLALACDCLITDYSSTVYDFFRLLKPVFLYVSDEKTYDEKRGLTPEYKRWPLPKVSRHSELISLISKFELCEYQNVINKYMSDNLFYGNGNASKKTAEWILDKINR